MPKPEKVNPQVAYFNTNLTNLPPANDRTTAEHEIQFARASALDRLKKRTGTETEEAFGQTDIRTEVQRTAVAPLSDA